MNFRVGNAAVHPPARPRGAPRPRPACEDRRPWRRRGRARDPPGDRPRSTSTSCTACARPRPRRPAVGRHLHDRQPRRHDGRRRALGRRSATPPTRRSSAPCAGPPTSSSSAPARCGRRATGRRGSPALRIGVVTARGRRRPGDASCSPAAPGSSSCPRTARRRPARRSTSCGPGRGRVDLGARRCAASAR